MSSEEGVLAPVTMMPGSYPDALTPGMTYATWFPFKRTTWIEFDAEGGTERPTWAPGWDSELTGSDGGDADPAWDGDGAMLLTVVSLHKPGPTYPERVFYTRQWRDPDGRVFGKKNLRVVSSRAFFNWLRGGKVAHLQFHDGLRPYEDPTNDPA